MIWNKLAELPWIGRATVKAAIFLVVVLAVLFPRPKLFVEQLGHYLDPESLIQPDMAAMPEINHEIDQMLPPDYSQQLELKTVERFVYQKIKYRYDWYNWGNIDYWPTASEVWRRKTEDCDGRAILAASILRSRGYRDAKIAGNLNHVWVTLDSGQLMGPELEQNFRHVRGKTVLSLPSLHTLIDTIAFLSKFPALRSLLIFFTAALLCYHPCRNLGGFFAVTTAGVSGFALLVNWGSLHLSHETSGLDLSFFLGTGLLGGALLLAVAMPLLLQQWPFRGTWRKPVLEEDGLPPAQAGTAEA